MGAEMLQCIVNNTSSQGQLCVVLSTLTDKSAAKIIIF